MANRAERRRQMREAHKKHQTMMENYTKEKMIEHLVKNGITQEDLKKEYEQGYDDGYRSATMPIMEACYAAICLVLNEEFNYDEDECIRVLNAVDQKVIFAIERKELCNEVFDKIGLQIDFGEPFDRISKQE